MENKPRRNTDTRAATRARQMRKWQRWVAELQANGWNGGRPILEPGATQGDALEELSAKLRALARRLADNGELSESTITEVLDGTYDPREL